MMDKKGFPYSTAYFILLVVVMAGAFLSFQSLPHNPKPGTLGNYGSFPSPRAGEMNPDILLHEGVQIVTRHEGRDCVLELPPELSRFSLMGISQMDLEAVLQEGWRVILFEPDRLILEYTGDLCGYCRDLHYIGLYEENIAIFQGKPPDGILLEVTRYPLKEVYREDLERGIPFNGEEEKQSILESYTT